MEGPSKRWLALWTSYFVFIFTGAIFFLVPPLLTELRQEVPMDDFAVGWLQAIYAVPAVLFAFVGGAALDRWDTRRTGIISCLLMLAGSLLFNAGGSYFILLAGRFLAGVGAVLINLVAAKMISIWFREKQKGLAMSILHTAWPISAIFAYSTFFPAAQMLGWKGTVLAINALMACSVAAFVLWAPREAERAVVPERTLRLREITLMPRDLWLAACAWLCFTVSMASVFTFGPGFLSMRGWGYGAGSFLIGLLMWSAIPGSLLAGWMMDRFGTLKSYIILPALGTALSLLLLQSALHPAPAILLAGLLAGAIPVAIYSLPGQVVEPARLGIAFGVILTFSNLGNTVGPVLVGWINTLQGEQATGMVLAAVVFIATAACAVALGGHRLATAREPRQGGTE